MKKRTLLIVSLLYGILSTGCYVVPISNSFESAKTLDEKQIEVMGNYSQGHLFLDNNDNELNHFLGNHNVGFRLGYGITDRFDIKFRYDRMFPAQASDKEIIHGVNYLELSPRYSIIRNQLSVGVKYSLYRPHSKDDTDEEGILNYIGPVLYYTYPLGERFELTLNPRIDYWIESKKDNDEHLFYAHLNFGLGYSTDFSKWVLRPELGFFKKLNHFKERNFAFSGGIALIILIDALK